MVINFYLAEQWYKDKSFDRKSLYFSKKVYLYAKCALYSFIKLYKCLVNIFEIMLLWSRQVEVCTLHNVQCTHIYRAFWEAYLHHHDEVVQCQSRAFLFIFIFFKESISINIDVHSVDCTALCLVNICEITLLWSRPVEICTVYSVHTFTESFEKHIYIIMMRLCSVRARRICLIFICICTCLFIVFFVFVLVF